MRVLTIRRRVRGFTLIEVIAVLVMTAALAGLVGVSLAGGARAAQLEEVVAGIEAFDELTRHQARRFNRHVRMELSLDGSWLRRVEVDSDAGDATEAAGHRMTLASDYRFTKVWLAGEVVTRGEVSIPCSALGHTPSYGLEVRRVVEGAPDGPVSWLMVAGLTGQIRRVSHEDEIPQILGAVSREAHQGRDAR